MPLAELVERFTGAPCRWWITGGVALELHLGRSWRAHDDSDVGLVRVDLPLIRDLLVGWDLHLAAGGRLRPWDGAPVGPATDDDGANNLWCRPHPSAPWALDVTIGDGGDGSWIFRRDPNLRRPWAKAVLETTDGVPYLAPELQLLFKSKNARPKDDVDAAEVIPELEASRRSVLAALLPVDHPWQQLMT